MHSMLRGMRLSGMLETSVPEKCKVFEILVVWVTRQLHKVIDFERWVSLTSAWAPKSSRFQGSAFPVLVLQTVLWVGCQNCPYQPRDWWGHRNQRLPTFRNCLEQLQQARAQTIKVWSVIWEVQSIVQMWMVFWGRGLSLGVTGSTDSRIGLPGRGSRPALSLRLFYFLLLWLFPLSLQEQHVHCTPSLHASNMSRYGLLEGRKGFSCWALKERGTWLVAACAWNRPSPLRHQDQILPVNGVSHI